MCGIAGFFGADHAPAQIEDALERMASAMIHRGPDEGSVCVWPEIGGGVSVRRLSIVDIPGGAQPAETEDGQVVAALNGEIYNHAALRRQLQSLGHRFRSRGDTEVIGHLYEEYGDAFLHHLRGMFALAVFDLRNRRLVLARDGAGLKHLYIAATSAGLAFASEAKALFAARVVDPRPSLEALDACLAISHIPAPLTAFEGISRLRAGEFLIATDRGIERDRFWRLAFARPERARTAPELEEELDSALQAAVRSHLAADVPVGALLSGGWDSSLVATYANEAAPGLKTFSIIFPDHPGTDEGRYSRLMARNLGSAHEEIEFRAAMLPECLPRVIRHLEEPAVNVPSGVGYWLFNLASRHVKAVVGGEGADELFGGYKWFSRSLPYRLRPFVPRALARSLAGRIPGQRAEQVLRFLAADDPRLADAEWHRRLTPNWKKQYLKPEFYRGAPDLEPSLIPDSFAATCTDLLQRRLAYDLNGRLPESILFTIDKLSMAHSLEVRAPFLDRSVMDFAARLPSPWKNDGRQAKVILGRLARRYLPPGIAARRKVGLSYPPDPWSKPPMAAFVREVLLDSGHRGPFQRASVERLLQSKQDQWKERTVRALVLVQLWWLEFIEPR
ncbi:MAG: asparagine synthase (glutamine-hydrolyzing) [Bryobacterales bacterium]|nr:asparagine synthase (glutamine-hydrolyzing) [Bryobacterales bacterium]